MIRTKELSDPKSCLNRAEDDELVFVLLGRDPAAAAAIRVWVSERIRICKNCITDPEIMEAMDTAEAIENLHRDPNEIRVSFQITLE